MGDIESILSAIPLLKIKNFIKEHIQSLAVSDADAVGIKSLPVTDILDVDVIQYVLSFNFLHEVNTVNQLFHALSAQNERIFLKKKLNAKYQSVQTTVEASIKSQKITMRVCIGITHNQ